MKQNRLRIALFHPWIKSRGGAERVVLEILKDKKYNIDIYTWVYDEQHTFKEFKKFNIKILAPKIFKRFSRSYFLRGIFLISAIFSKINLEKYDIFLISTGGLAELITLRNNKPEKTFAYVHTILRATYEEDIKWNLKHMHKKHFPRFLYLFFIKLYLILERISWKKIDVAIFNSELSLKRAKKHNLIKNKKTHIIYPPIDVEKFSKLKTKKENYFLYASRIHPRKRQDLLIKSWTKFVEKHPDYKLIISGNIENKKYFKKLKKLANKTKNVELKYDVEEKEYLKLISNCSAGIFIPFMEDFGIVPFEILAAGKPLIAVNKGGYVNLIKKIPQVILIDEKDNEKEMIKEINKGLENFLKSRKIPKKIIIKDTDSKNFIKKLEKIIK